MVNWNLQVLLLFILVSAPLLMSQDAYDDEAFEESGEAKHQRLEAEFRDAVSIINEGGLGKGLKDIKRLAVQGHPRSQYMLGMFFRYGTGVRKSSKRSVQWLKLASDQQFPAAMLAYAEVAVSGDGMREDDELARELLEPLAAKEWNFPVPMEDFGVMRSVRSQASYMLGNLLAEGKGGAEDFERAIVLMKNASDTGYVYASMFLALEYAKGDKLERNLETARRYFDLVELQMMDSVRRELEKVMIGIVDPVVEEEIRENAAEMGSALAEGLTRSQRIIGERFLKEGSEEYDPEIAASLLKMAADGGDAVSQSILGQLYWHGLGVEQNRVLAKELFGKAAEGESTVGRYNSAILLLAEGGDEDDGDRARELLATAADSGHFAAQLVLDGEDGFSVISDDEDLNLAKQWAERGDERAVFALTKRAERGWNMARETNEKKLYKSYLSSAKKGYHRAQIEVAKVYYHGTGVDINFGKAYDWFNLSAEQGNSNAYFWIGYMSNGGIGTPQNRERAFVFYEKAVEAGDRSAANNLANYYFDGIVVEKDEARAFELYELAANQGNSVASYNIGKKYLEGEGVEQQVDKGLEWLVKSGEDGYVSAILKLCDYYQEGNASSDFVELAYWREKAAEYGDMKSMKETAIYYKNGVGVPESKIKALYWISEYIRRGRVYKIQIRQELMDHEPISAIGEFLPMDYEAVLLYASLLMEEDWPGHNLEEAFEIASLFAKTDLFAGRLLLAELHLMDGIKRAKPKAGLRLYEEVYEDALSEKRFYKHAVKAAYRLSKAYGGGLRVKADDALCVEWMKRAADIGLKRAQFMYAQFLWDGVGGKQDRGTATLYWVRLSNKGYDKATLLLGELFVAGETVDLDRSELETRLREIMDEGNSQARAILRAMGVDLPPAKERQDEEVSPDDYYRPAVLG